MVIESTGNAYGDIGRQRHESMKNEWNKYLASLEQ
jgi:hypothetical protein